jgi:hypothetical protein
MRLTDKGGVELLPEEAGEFPRFKDGLCSFVQHVLDTDPDNTDFSTIVFPHMMACETCAIAVSQYFTQRQAT